MKRTRKPGLLWSAELDPQDWPKVIVKNSHPSVSKPKPLRMLAATTPTWIEGTRTGVINPCVSASGGSPRTQVIYMNAVYATDPQPYPDNQWITIDVSKTVYGEPTGIPSDVIAIDLTGILILSPGYSICTPDIHLHVRRDASASDDYMIAQCCCTSPTNGARTNFGVPVTVKNTKFDMLWTRATPGFWPDQPAYGLIAWVTKYERP